jgi:hypothetical protein
LVDFVETCRKPSVPEGTYDFHELCLFSSEQTPKSKQNVENSPNLDSDYTLAVLQRCYDRTKVTKCKALVVYREGATDSDAVDLLNFFADTDPKIQQLDEPQRSNARRVHLRNFLVGEYTSSQGSTVKLEKVPNKEGTPRLQYVVSSPGAQVKLTDAVKNWTGIDDLQFRKYTDRGTAEVRAFVVKHKVQKLKTWLNAKGRVAFLAVKYNTNKCDFLQVQLVCSAPHAPPGVGAMLHLMFLDAARQVGQYNLPKPIKVVLEVANPALTSVCLEVLEKKKSQSGTQKSHPAGPVTVPYGAGEMSNAQLVNYYTRLGYVRLPKQLSCFDKNFPYTNMEVNLNHYKDGTAQELATNPKSRLNGITGELNVEHEKLNVEHEKFAVPSERSRSGVPYPTCAGTTKSGRACRRRPSRGSKYCSSHPSIDSERVDVKSYA